MLYGKKKLCGGWEYRSVSRLLSWHTETWVRSPVPRKLGMADYPWTLSAKEVEVGGSGVQGQLGFHETVLKTKPNPNAAF